MRIALLSNRRLAEPFTACRSLLQWATALLALCMIAGMPNLVIAISCSHAADLGNKNGMQWELLEWRLDNPSWTGNAFDIVATVTFENGSESRTTEMFYDGGTVYKFRFTPTRTGNWTYFTTSNDNSLNGYTGSVTVYPNPESSAHGFLKQFGDKWGWQGAGKVFVPQYVMYASNPKNYHKKPAKIDADIKEFLVDHGFSGFHTGVVGGRWFDIDKTKPIVSGDEQDPDPRTFEALELLITKTHAAGGAVHIWAWGDHDRHGTSRSLAGPGGGANGSRDRRLQRYIASRLGPIPGWSMGYGFDLQEWALNPNIVKPWRDYLHERLGWPHFLGGRHGVPSILRGARPGDVFSVAEHRNKGSQLFNNANDYSGYQHHKPTYQTYVNALLAVPGQPAFSEDRFRIRKSKYTKKDYSEEEIRRGLWHSTMAGGVANIWGKLAPGSNAVIPFQNKKELKTYAVFWNDCRRFLPGMVRDNTRSDNEDTFVLRQGTSHYVFYRENHNSMHIDLTGASGPLTAVAVDAKLPYSEVTLKLIAGSQTVKLGRKSDWAIAVGDFNKGTQAFDNFNHEQVSLPVKSN